VPVLDRDARVPKNHVDSEKLADSWVRLHGGAVAGKRSRRRQHLRLHEAAREESIETVLALADSRLERATRGQPVAWPSATAANSPRRYPKWTSSRLRREFDGVPAVDARRSSDAECSSFDPFESAATEAATAVGLRQDRRRMRSAAFCAYRRFRGDQRSRSTEEILVEAERSPKGRARTGPDRPGPRRWDTTVVWRRGDRSKSRRRGTQPLH